MSNVEKVLIDLSENLTTNQLLTVCLRYKIERTFYENNLIKVETSKAECAK